MCPRYENLLSADEVSVALTNGARLDSGGLGSGVRLGDSKSLQTQLAVRDRRKVALLLFRASVAELQAVRQRDCRVSALLRFLRVPYLEEVTGGARVLGDLRFDREPDLGFGGVLLSNDPPECPRFLPGWVPPRSDLFEREP